MAQLYVSHMLDEARGLNKIPLILLVVCRDGLDPKELRPELDFD